MSRYTATISWQRGAEGVTSASTFAENRYSRAHRWQFDGGADVLASASPSHVPKGCADPAGVDPEEAFVAALSSCHMLFFLYFAANAGWVVDSYVDRADGILRKNADGRLAVMRVTLRPHVVFSGAASPTAAEIDALHHAAHERCFIANSVRTEVVVETGG